MAHAKLSPSSAVRWMQCPGSVALSEGIADVGSKFAQEGTAAHFLASECLEKSIPASEFADLTIYVIKGKTFWSPEDKSIPFIVTPEMVLEVQKYLDYVNDVVKATSGVLLVEQRLSISGITGEDDAFGTSDVVILAADELIVIDLKFGMGLKVDAEDNPQLQIYALAALNEFGIATEFKTVRMVIHQPRLNHVSEWTQTIDELEDFGIKVWNASKDTKHVGAKLIPEAKACKFCRAEAKCPAIANLAMCAFEEVTPIAEQTDSLAKYMAQADLIEGWVKAIRAEVESRLLSGVAVEGFKIVQGKRGNRAWTNAEEAETLLKAMRVKHHDMYEYKLISPTTADKLAQAETIGPRQWPRVQELITQAEGKPSVAPDSDKRPALVMSAIDSDFSDVS